MLTDLDLTIPSLQARYRNGTLRPREVTAELVRRITETSDANIWITLSDRLIADTEALQRRSPDGLPLYGVPFALKDNIDVAGIPTTAVCPEFAYVPDVSAAVTTTLIEAGALFVGKANMDQFATGLNGTRSPYGTVHAAHDRTLISGGSSSGSAVAVARELVSFALGTDTAGSGRVPAALNGVVGLKPTVGLVSGRGVVPNCRTIDATSVLARTVADATLVHSVIAGYDQDDPWCTPLPLPSGNPGRRPLAGLKFGVPAEIPTWGARGEDSAWRQVCEQLEASGALVVALDYAPLYEAGKQMYLGPWVAERVADLYGFLRANNELVHPSVRALYESSNRISARDTYAALHRLYELRREVTLAFGGVDALLSPTVPATFTIEEVIADPVATNEVLGTFTTYTNLIGMCAVSVPIGRTTAEVPFSVQVQTLGPTDDLAASIAMSLEATLKLGKARY